MLMDVAELSKYNPWWQGSIEEDRDIKRYEQATLRWRPNLMCHIDATSDAVWSVRGPRQVGKTTMVKLLIKDRLEQGMPARNILYFACDLIRDQTDLFDVISTYHQWIRSLDHGRLLLCLDEVSRVEDWQHAIKHFVDLYGLEGITFILTSSHSIDLKTSTERLPGRTGELGAQHKILLPMKFSEYVGLRASELELPPIESGDLDALTKGHIPASARALLPFREKLDTLLQEYLLTGGVITACNDFVDAGHIRQATFDMYVRQIIGDLSAIRRQEQTAKAILEGVIDHITTHVSLDSLRKKKGIPSPSTMPQYIGVLSDMFLVNELFRIHADGRVDTAKEKKLYIPNPFFFHAIRGWTKYPTTDHFEAAVSFLQDSQRKSQLIESVVGDHLARASYNLKPRDTFSVSDSIFYHKNKRGAETDFVLRTEGHLMAFDVVYQNSINSEDLKPLQSFTTGCMITKKDLNEQSLYGKQFAFIPASLFLLYV